VASPWSTSTAGDRRRSDGGWLRNSKLAFACFGLFLVFLLAQSVRTYDADQIEHGEPAVSYPEYLTTVIS